VTEETAIPDPAPLAPEAPSDTPAALKAARLARALDQFSNVLKDAQAWSTRTRQLHGYLSRQSAGHALREYGQATAKIDPDTDIVSVMWPRISWEAGEQVYQILEVAIDGRGSGRVRETIIDSHAAVLYPLVENYYTFAQFKVERALNSFYELVPTIVPPPGYIYPPEPKEAAAAGHDEVVER